MRAIIHSILYAPSIGRYKVYIIDEVHMLSNSAFNALLKTLEEPPAHIKFIFATTEIRKVPITVLSRCQRFDLRRLNVEELAAHLKNILGQEGFEIENDGGNFIAEAADGSVRDLLSITDRILSHSNYQKTLSTDAVVEVLGLNDKNKIIDLLATILAGDVTNALQILEKFYESSTDINNLITDLQKITHLTTLVKTVDNYRPQSLSETAQQKITDLANKASLVDLTRIWQMLLKGSVEVSNCASQKMMMEMLLIRICYLADLPNLEQIIAKNSTLQAANPQIETTPNQDSTKQDLANKDLAGEVMRNFSDAKIVS
jgi:DNA polymerase-3 subunit gamma/tau